MSGEQISTKELKVIKERKKNDKTMNKDQFEEGT